MFRGKISKLSALVAILALLVVLAPGAAPPAQAGSGEDTFYVGAGVVGAVVLSTMAYYMWVNRPSQQPRERPILPGDLYVAGFVGGSLVQSNQWTLTNFSPFSSQPIFADPVKYQRGVVGGLKFGYFCSYFPYLGIEAETNFTRNDIRYQLTTLSLPRAKHPSIPGAVPEEDLYIWTLALKLVARYGFFPDQEVPFGRLQPYVGIGPGVVVIYGDTDSAKNFSLEVQAGIRYMALKKVSLFVEYKYSRQWDVELESQTLHGFSGGRLLTFRGLSKFDFDAHKVVFGVAYHFQ